MPTNLPPQYHEVEQRYRRSKSVPEKVAALQEMLGIMPKHKGTDHLRAELRARLSRHLEELERPKAGGGGGPQPFNIRKEGAGQVLVIGLANCGKSALVATLTGAPAKVGDYPFTTQIPVVGMLPFENIQVQMVDTPALNDRDTQTRLFGLLRQADLLLVVLDLTTDAVEQLGAIQALLDQWGYSLRESGEALELEGARIQKEAMLVGNKYDAEGASQRFEGLKKAYDARFTLARVSCLDDTGLDTLGREVFKTLAKVRAYTKTPGRPPDLDDPIILPQGSTVADAAEHLHKDWRQKLKYAVLWGSGRFSGQRVGRDYVLADGDIIELHG